MLGFEGLRGEDAVAFGKSFSDGLSCVDFDFDFYFLAFTLVPGAGAEADGGEKEALEFEGLRGEDADGWELCLDFLRMDFGVSDGVEVGFGASDGLDAGFGGGTGVTVFGGLVDVDGLSFDSDGLDFGGAMGVSVFTGLVDANGWSSICFVF